MLIPLTPFLWSMIQVTLLSSVALVVSWLARGRVPQWTSSILAGSTFAAFLLTLLTWLPYSHWSLASLLQSGSDYSDRAVIGSVEARQKENSESDAASERATIDRRRAFVKQDWPGTPASEQLAQWIMNSSIWLNSSLRSMDSGIRQLEPTTPTSETSLGWIQSFISLIILMLAGLWLHSWVWIRWIVRSSRPIDDEALRLKVDILAKRLGIRALPDLLQSPRVAIGATVGFWRRRLILSPDWKDWSQVELDAVLSHELAHMLRNDYAWVFLSSWIRVLLFYHPLIHLLIRRLRMEQELAADQLAAGLMDNARAYGRALASLALRAECAAKVPSSVLTAEQVCIVRRIAMLKQGSLRPIHSRRPWSALVIVLTVMAVGPLSGLRGTPPETPTSAITLREEPTNTDDTEELSQEEPSQVEARARLEESILTQKQFPPLNFVGRLKWEPKKLLTEDASPSMRYIQDLASFALFEQFLADAQVEAPATATLRWETRARDFGLFFFGATWNNANTKGVPSELILRHITNPLLTNFNVDPTITKTIAGKKAVRLVAKGRHPLTRQMASDDDPAHWFIQEGEAFYFGTESRIIATLKSQESPKQDPTQEPEQELTIEVPEAYRAQFESSAFALVYDHCDQWDERLKEFFAGSPKESQAQLILPYLKGLTQLGIFLDASLFPGGRNTFPLCIRIGYESEEAAREGMVMMHALLGLARLIPADDESAPFARELAEHTQLFVLGKEVLLQVADTKLIDMLCEHEIPETLVGWTDILATVTATDSPGTVELTCNHGFGTAGYLAQSVEAQSYRGKRVRVSADIGGSESEHSRSGTILWGSDAQGRTLGNAASGKSIGRPIEPSEILKTISRPAQAEPMVWQRKSVEWNVPDTASAISFGIYVAAGEVLVKNVKFEVIGTATNASETQLAASPRNILRVPTRTLLAKPTNLDFSEVPAVRTATRNDSLQK